MLHWTVYLADGTAFSNEDGHPWEVPLTGVVAIAQADKKVNHTVTVGFNYYYYRDGEWWGCYDSAAMLLEVCTDQSGLIRTVRAGRSVSNELFNEIRGRARHEHDNYQLRQPIHSVPYDG